MKVAVDRKALEINRRISDVSLHHPPILIKHDSGAIYRDHYFELPQDKKWRVVYEPDPKKVWTEVGDDGQYVNFNVWIETVD